MNPESYIEAYPVGILLDFQRGWLRGGMQRLRENIRRRRWRSVRNYFNGYLAEWHYPPEGVRHYRCGKGWTRKAAIKDLGRHIARVNSIYGMDD